MTTVYTYTFLLQGGSVSNLNLNPNGVMQDCCDGGALIGTASLTNKRLFIRNTFKNMSADYPVQTGQTFSDGELVKIDPATGTITKLTAAPVIADILAIVIYDLDNTAASVTAGKATPRASVLISGDGINEAVLKLPAGVTMSDSIRAILASKELLTAKIHGY